MELSTNFTELNAQEIEEVEGGGILPIILLGAASYFVASIVDEGVKRATGKTIVQHGTYYGGKAISAVGDALQTAGNYLSR